MNIEQRRDGEALERQVQAVFRKYGKDTVWRKQTQNSTTRPMWVIGDMTGK